jgi:D-glycerate 3-kinase
LRQTSQVLYIAVDSLIPARGKSASGFDEFTAALDHGGIPAVWLTSRSRLQFDEPRRRAGHRHPFIAEDGCAVYLPEDYFHLRPGASGAHSAKSTIRLGRFMCIPVAEKLPAAAERLEELSEDVGVPIVTLRSLTPRELVQNTGLPQREAELARQRDFDDVFFFAGASDEQVQKFLTEGRKRNMDFRQHGALWSAAAGSSVSKCIRELSKLYDRALHHHAHSVGLATKELAAGLLPFCDRSILLVAGPSEESINDEATLRRQAQRIGLDSSDRWEQVLQAVGL